MSFQGFSKVSWLFKGISMLSWVLKVFEADMPACPSQNKKNLENPPLQPSRTFVLVLKVESTYICELGAHANYRVSLHF